MTLDTNIGHNSGNNLQSRLANIWGGLINRCNDLMNAARGVPDQIEDEETATKAADLIKLMKAAAKEADSTRKQENEPFAQAKREVDAFFNIPKEALEQRWKDVEFRLTKYLQKKAALEEERRRERAEQERAEAERKFNDAIEAEKRANEAKHAAQVAKATGDAARADKEEVLAKSRDARQRAQAAEFDMRAAKAQNDGKAYQDAADRRDVAFQELRALDDRALELRKIEREAEEKRKQEEKAAREASREVKHAVEDAQRSDGMAKRLDKQSEAKQSELSRTRGELGSVSSLRTDWVHDELDRALLDLEALRAHLPEDALNQAVRSFIRAGGRQLRGVRIFEQTTTVVR